MHLVIHNAYARSMSTRTSQYVWTESKVSFQQNPFRAVKIEEEEGEELLGSDRKSAVIIAAGTSANGLRMDCRDDTARREEGNSCRPSGH